jgi:tetratricopeptide (TPR) repeat protein
MTSQTLPIGWTEHPQTAFVIAADGGLDRSTRLRDELDRASRGGSRTWYLVCDFEEGGPWAGIRDLLRGLVAELSETRPELLAQHAYELVHVLPTLRRQVAVHHESLTDVSLGSERVRNFPADRAFRIVHGLINFMEKARKPDDSPWIIACDFLDRAGPLARQFFRELLRRRGRQLRLVLLAAVAPERAENFQAALSEVAFTQTIYWTCLGGGEVPFDAAEERRRAEHLEMQTEDPAERQELIPDLIRAWGRAGDQSRVFRWRVKALELNPMLGFYADALRYSEWVLPEVENQAPGHVDLRWVVFFKTFVSLVSVQRTEEALRLAEAEGLRRLYAVKPIYRAQILYLIAMVYVRFLSPRNLTLGEEFLERGLLEVEKISDPEERAFSHVFNRNGLALIRNFQGRQQEAIDLCREGYEHLRAELAADKHRLHRSVLLYNIAQVYAALGDHEEAIAQYSAAMAMDPHYSEYYNERGSLMLALGRLQEAYTDYCTAIELSPPYPEVFTNLGQCCRRLRRLEEAVAAYSTALDLRPDLLLAYVGRAQIYDEMGRPEEALIDYDSALLLQPDAADLLANRAVLLYGAGRMKESLTDLNRALKLAPEMPELYQNRALLLAELGRGLEAITDLRALLLLLPTGTEARLEVEDKILSMEKAALPSGFDPTAPSGSEYPGTAETNRAK